MTYALTQSARLIFRPSTPAIALSPHTRLPAYAATNPMERIDERELEAIADFFGDGCMSCDALADRFYAPACGSITCIHLGSQLKLAYIAHQVEKRNEMRKTAK